MTINNITDGGNYLLHTLDNIEISTTDESETIESVAVTITLAWGDSNSVTLLSETYYAYDNVVTVHDIRTLIENAMRSNKISYASVTVSASANFVVVSATVNVLFSTFERGLTFDQLCSSYFISSYIAKVIYDTSLTEIVSYLAGASQTVKVTCVGVNSDGDIVRRTTTNAVRKTESSAISEYQFGFVPDTYLAAWQAEDSTVVALRSMSVVIGDRHATFYIASDRVKAPAVQFIFRNEYNAIECFNILGVTTRKTSASHEVAKSGHSYVAYDHSVSQEFDFESAAMGSYPRNSVESFFCAKDVSIRESNSLARDIIITDVTSELGDGIGDVDTVKFSYQYVKDVPVIPTRKKSTQNVINNVYDDNFA